jgi:glucose/arabinose dehydrogenase
VATAIAPDYALGSHVAPLGMVFVPRREPAPKDRGGLPARFSSGAFVGEHGSWNRRPLSGYQVVFVPFERGMPHGTPVEVLSGFVDREGNALGRPVGVAIDKSGALLVADDVGNTVWRVSTTHSSP